MAEKQYEPMPRPFQRALRDSLQAQKPTSLTIRKDAAVPLVDQDLSVLRALERLIRGDTYASAKDRHSEQWLLRGRLGRLLGRYLSGAFRRRWF